MKKSRRTRSSDLLPLLAFIIVVFSAVAWVLNALGINAGILLTIARYCLYVVVLWSGWLYASKLSKTWQIIYLVIAILAILGAFGVLL